MTSHVPNEARVIPMRPRATRPQARPTAPPTAVERRRPAVREPLWRDLVGGILRQERLAQERTLKEVAETARISMPYLSEVERGRKEASSEVLAAAAGALGLGLGDLLARAQGELVRLASRHSGPGRGPGASGARFDGMCLAA
ncbi:MULTISPECIES: helix-turn-helix transcriptional regulator [unclassified Streptomyces]|uniref:helix-turn-helix domain-containing protein n=1 Tax=Streptomyces TaxID=1883 RepID=UPI000BD14286|nr:MULTISPECIES: helix-turn-helix transcriptional regulator [unclassified Streptomyces]MDN3248364.1 helix-turn-helix transcriptional regulator [Streptomyces sp. ZSW22]MDN3254500.1 helix-turn-helix transcriptional regulator [Streptomyces sp. MA25(2023)]PAK23632.1 transcriptional regulator [Streptomyces sp. alain-838]